MSGNATMRYRSSDKSGAVAESRSRAADHGDAGVASGQPQVSPQGGSDVKYATIVADPPWPYPEGFARSVGGRYGRGTQEGWIRRATPYATMTVYDLCALNVKELAAKDCRLWLWATNRYLHDAFHVAAAWGFTYRQTVIWHKTGSPNPWIAHIAPTHSEFLLVAVRGKPARLAALPSSVLSVDANPAKLAHSQKPEAFLDYIESVSPGPYLELFARRNRIGWDTWGDEALEHLEISA